MSRRNSRRARSSKPAGRTTESQSIGPKPTKQIKKQKRRERRDAKRNKARNHMREPAVDSDGDIDAISESDAESEQQQQSRRRNTNQEKMDLGRHRPFNLQRLHTAVTSIIQECAEEFDVGSRLDDYMDWQPEPPRPVYLVLWSEMPCYPAGKVCRP